MKYSAGTLPHEKMMRRIELYGTKVMPLVREMLGQEADVIRPDQPELRARRLGMRALGMRPASRDEPSGFDRRAHAVAIGTGSCAFDTAVLTMTAAQPSSIASAASEAVPIPASSTTGTGVRAQIAR